MFRYSGFSSGLARRMEPMPYGKGLRLLYVSNLSKSNKPTLIAKHVDCGSCLSEMLLSFLSFAVSNRLFGF